ncbi:MAG TPA: four-carbon acid sugar kinase family protein, partial [Tepidisphaeraceae bacterium]|nr:four-carbon acid sugar kinase family protein [Tepidisphaeraceae bacterium]
MIRRFLSVFFPVGTLAIALSLYHYRASFTNYLILMFIACISYCVIDILITWYDRPWRPISRPDRYRIRSREKNSFKNAIETISTLIALRRGADLALRLPIPQERPKDDVATMIASQRERMPLTIVIEDDPVGPMIRQPVPAILFSESDIFDETMDSEFSHFVTRVTSTRIGYVVTPSRFLNDDQSLKLFNRIMALILRELRARGIEARVVIRTDSCLRTAFDWEDRGIDEATRANPGMAFDLRLYCPAYVEAGRVTIEGVQYLNDTRGIAPIHKTEFARFSGLEYRDSDLAAWIHFKTKGRIHKKSIELVTSNQLRTDPIDDIIERLLHLPRGTTVVLDCFSEPEAVVAAEICRRLETDHRRRILYRVGPTLMRALCGWTWSAGSAVQWLKFCFPQLVGPGLVVAGSLTSVSKAQIMVLRESPDVVLELFEDVEMGDPGKLDRIAALKASKVDEMLSHNYSAILTTSHWTTKDTMYPDRDARKNVLHAFAKVIARLKKRPKWIVLKGSDTAYYMMSLAFNA